MKVFTRTFPDPRTVEVQLKKNSLFCEQAICPYCHSKLKKQLQRKTKCPYCNQPIFVRTNLISRKKMLLTEEQKEKLEKEREKISAQLELMEICRRNGIGENEFLSHFNANLDISPNDAVWYLSNKKGMEYAKDMQWGLYRNTRFDMLEVLLKENRKKEALEMACEVFYYDINGATNIGNLPKKLLKKYPPFDKRQSFIAPAVISYISNLIEELGVSEKELNKIMISRCEKVRNRWMPVKPKEAWKKLKEALGDNL